MVSFAMFKGEIVMRETTCICIPDMIKEYAISPILLIIYSIHTALHESKVINYSIIILMEY